ncbi:hypothetical protein TorRG33x02_033940 [Trema orientale]|uniref:Uncharacterized protein n=1 Tax=Trema orientale TaxID=63057 RepID=A0A2P5FSJ1_TREOI|nr:hypothetical protein TorRG33x02_033940 [Trema orientale]
MLPASTTSTTKPLQSRARGSDLGFRTRVGVELVYVSELWLGGDPSYGYGGGGAARRVLSAPTAAATAPAANAPQPAVVHGLGPRPEFPGRIVQPVRASVGADREAERQDLAPEEHFVRRAHF